MTELLPRVYGTSAEVLPDQIEPTYFGLTNIQHSQTSNKPAAPRVKRKRRTKVQIIA